MTPARVVVLISGTGSLCAALLAAAAEPRAPFQIVAVGADRPAPGLEHARSAGVPAFVVAPGDFAARSQWDEALAREVARWQPDWVVSAGFMRLLGPAVLDAFGMRVINSHPALLPAFPGTHGVRDALAYGVKVTGCTVHFVDAGVDSGPIIEQRAVPVLADDDEASLHERIKVVERDLLVDVLTRLVRHGARLADRKVLLT